MPDQLGIIWKSGGTVTEYIAACELAIAKKWLAIDECSTRVLVLGDAPSIANET